MPERTEVEVDSSTASAGPQALQGELVNYAGTLCPVEQMRRKQVIVAVFYPTPKQEAEARA